MRHLRGFLRYNVRLYTNSCTFQYLSIETHHTEYMSAWISLEQHLVGQQYLLLQRVLFRWRCNKRQMTISV